MGGALPTPAAPLLVRRRGYDLGGRAVGASHNPYEDNGIKFFGGDGFKLGDATELEIDEGLVEDLPAGALRGVGRLFSASTAPWRSTSRALHSIIGSTFEAAGSCLTAPTAPPSVAAPEIFRRLGADVDRRQPPNPMAATSTPAAAPRTWITCAPRMYHTATTPAPRSTAMRTGCSRSTDGVTVVDGDQPVVFAALDLRGAGPSGTGRGGDDDDELRLHTGDGAARGIEVATTPVGDRYVPEALRERCGRRGRTVGPHHRHDLRAFRRRHRAALLALEASGARPARSPRHGQAPPEARNSSSPTARAERGDPGYRCGRSSRVDRSRRPRAGAPASQWYRAPRAASWSRRRPRRGAEQRALVALVERPGELKRSSQRQECQAAYWLTQPWAP